MAMKIVRRKRALERFTVLSLTEWAERKKMAQYLEDDTLAKVLVLSEYEKYRHRKEVERQTLERLTIPVRH